MALCLIMDSLHLYLIKYIMYMPAWIFMLFLTYLQNILSIEALRDCMIASLHYCIIMHNYSMQCHFLYVCFS